MVTKIQKIRTYSIGDTIRFSTNITLVKRGIGHRVSKLHIGEIVNNIDGGYIVRSQDNEMLIAYHKNIFYGIKKESTTRKSRCNSIW